MGMTEWQGVTAGSNEIKLGKGNEGLMIDFLMENLFSFVSTVQKN